MESFTYYAFCIIAAVVAFFILKRVASCLLRLVITILVVVLMAYVYLNYFNQ